MENITDLMSKFTVPSSCNTLMRWVPVLLIFLLVGVGRGFAEPDRRPDGRLEPPSSGDQGAQQAEAEKPEEGGEEKEHRSVTTGRVEIGGKEVRYRATAGTIKLDKVGKRPAASVFYIAYERQPKAKGKAKNKGRAGRPVTFCFNGGPGSSSVWLHLGAFGPKRVKLNRDGTGSAAPPFRLVPNAHSLLDVTDLVFIDPVSTGYSRPDKPEEAGAFHGFQEDIDSVAEFVRLYVTREGRWASPKFLAGESYGAIRASGLAQVLQDRFGMYLNGVVIVSGVWDFRTLLPHTSNDLPYMLFLPTMAATAHYHGKLDGDLGGLIAEAEEFALGDYARALHQGGALPDGERRRVAARLAELTALDAGRIADANLRINPSFFRKELLRDRGETVGRFDGRVLGRDPKKLGMYPSYDPSYSGIYGAYSSTMNAYLRDELEFESDLPYEILSRKVRPWNYGDFTNRYVSVADHVGGTLRANEHIRYFIACGHYDLATPHLAITYTLDHLEIAPSLRENFEFGHYEGGHMMYTNPDALEALKGDLADFIRESKGG